MPDDRPTEEDRTRVLGLSGALRAGYVRIFRNLADDLDLADSLRRLYLATEPTSAEPRA